MEKERKLTPLFLKTFAQKFDLMTMFLLDLSKKGIGNIGSLPECQNLLMVDLSNNQLMVISGLEALINLKHINLSYNKLT
jgi:Leucine-rich repeat (LRR) protein